MTSNTTADWTCYPPFLAEPLYPSKGGYLEGRLCSKISADPGAGNCCLPCPLTDWIYPDNFYHHTRIPGFVSLVSLLLCAFMLLCFAVLPAEKTRRQYLNVCLIFSIFIFELSFAIPVLAKPNHCYDAITPQSQRDSVMCAFTGAFGIFGALATNMWTFVRSLSMHLMVCWDITPKKTYYWSVQALAWSVSFLLLGICLGFTGVSVRFGDYCLVNHDNDFATLWGPILGIASITAILQISTFLYCLHVYLTGVRAERVRENGANQSMSGQQKRQKARAVAQRVKKVLSLQWRALAIVTTMVVYIIYFSIVFVTLDNEYVKALQNVRSILPWAACLIETQGDKDKCLSLAKPLTISEPKLIATLSLFSVLGIQAALLVGRWGMITGWIDLFRAYWLWRSGRGDIGFDEASNDGAVKELEEQRNSTQQPMVMGDKKTFELVRIDDETSGKSRLAAIDTKRTSGRGTVSSTLSSGNYGSDDIGVAVVDEEDDFAYEYLKEYGGASFNSPPAPHDLGHRHKKSGSGGWTRHHELRTQSAESITALPAVRASDEKGRLGVKNWPL